MNLWGNRVGQLAVLAVALFFFSCEDETSLLGYKNPTSKFNLKYIDLPVETSVLLLDSVRTSNFNAGNDVNRFLVGNCTDDVLGDLKASFYTQFLPVTTLVEDDSLVFDSVALQLRTDFYVYGTGGKTYQTINIHELTDDLEAFSTTSVTVPVGGQQTPAETNYYGQRFYFNKSTVGYNPTPLGVKGISADYDDFKVQFPQLEKDQDTTLLNVVLDDAFGQRLFDLAVLDDSLFHVQSFFYENFKGLAFVPSASSDKIIGFNPASAWAKMTMHYHSLKGNGTNKDTLTMVFSFNRPNQVAGFSKIESDRSGTDLASLTTPYVEYTATDKRYVQAGVGITTKLDLSAFVEFADTITRIAINSTELLIKKVDDRGKLTPPKDLLVKVLDTNNRLLKPGYPGNTGAFQDEINSMNLYRGTVSWDPSIATHQNTVFDSTLLIRNDIQGFFTLTYSDSEKKYSGTSSLFFQELFKNSKVEGNKLYTKVALIPYLPAAPNNVPGSAHLGKTVDGAAFHKDDIVMRVYYTIPTVNN